MSLIEEISKKRKDIVVDSYPVSIGEIVNIYKDGELDIHPEFQRVFRWDDDQKTKLIESILLGIPVPPIFVAQKIDGKWDVIDGQQRLSSILQFLHVLKNDDGDLCEALKLKSTKFLPSLDGVLWEDENKFTSEQKITFKREKLHFTIIKETTDNTTAKYEMFQRLNTSGSHLSAQELRNCLLIMINRDLYIKLTELKKNQDFQSCLPLPEAKSMKEFDMELIVRFLLYTSFTQQKLLSVDKNGSMDEFLTTELENYASDSKIIGNYKEVENSFNQLFYLLNKLLGENTFKKFSSGKFKGSVMVAAYEAIIPGLCTNLTYWSKHESDLESKIMKIYDQSEFLNATKPGTRALDRMVQLIQFSRSWFAHEN